MRYDKNLKPFSRQLRLHMTEAEKRIWSRIRSKQLEGYQFYRQKIIGEYIVDFYCPKAQMVIEVDGGQHYETEGQENDTRRDSVLNNLGYKVMRYSNREVFENITGVVESIQDVLLGSQSP